MGHFKLITEHKPLVPLINCQQLLLILMRFNVIAEYAPGKTKPTKQHSGQHYWRGHQLLCQCNRWKPAGLKWENIRNSRCNATRWEVAESEALNYNRWPEHAQDVHPLVRDFLLSELSETDGLLIRGNHIIILSSRGNYWTDTWRTPGLDQI